MIDVGAGTGRDAAWFAERGYKVLAVEPVAAFRETMPAYEGHPAIEWLDDRLPDLARVLGRNECFDVVMVSGVWQHIDDAARKIAMAALAQLTGDGGAFVLSLRHGPGSPARPCYPCTAEDTVTLAKANGLRVVYLERRASIQPQNRAAGVNWTWLVLTQAG